MLYLRPIQYAVLVYFLIGNVFCYAKTPDFVNLKVNLDTKPNIGADVEKSILYIFSALSKKNKAIDFEQIKALLTLTESKVSSGTVSIKDKNGKGAFLRESIHAPIDTVISYYFNSAIPLEVIHPAGTRTIIPLRNSENIPKNDVANFLNKTQKDIKVYFGYDREETTPDLFTGASYSYPIKKMNILLPEYNGKRIALVVNQQMENSTISTKAVTIGDDQNWNYIYSSLQGSTDESTSWVKSRIYDSAMILLIVENPANNTTEVFLFKWLRAGWLRINVVSSSHIYRGSKRVLYSMNKVLSSPHVPSPEEIVAKYSELRRMQESDLRNLLHPYSVKLSEIALKNPILKTNEWTPFVTDAKYASTLNKTNIVSLLVKTYVKERIGIPSL